MSRITQYLGSLIITVLVVSLLGWMPDSVLAQQEQPTLTSQLREAREVMNTPVFEEAVAYVDGAEDETVREWLSLCNAYGPQGDEIFRSRLLYKLFRIYGLKEVRIDDQRNVVGVRPGTGDGPTVVLNAHHDAVALWPKEQPIEAFVADGRVWCPAAGDDLMGVTQMLTVLRAMNAANVETKGDVWFVSLTEEEVGSPGAEHFVRANYPHNIDWHDGDIMVQFHGGGGEGVTTGSNPYIHFTQLRVYTPLDEGRWEKDAADVLPGIMQRINDELRDPRSSRVSEYDPSETGLTGEIFYLNMSMVEGDPIHNGTTEQAWIRLDMRSPSEDRLREAHQTIQRIGEEECQRFEGECRVAYEINMTLGTGGIEGWNKADNRPARVAAAAARALYKTTPVIDSTRGCGDCRRSYMGGMPAFSLRGSVIDRGDGDFEIRQERGRLESRVRRKSTGHDVTESGEIVELWSGIKHGLLFALAYAELAN